ncbi:hypothetical protein AAMO2058_000577000 [Amorphochlora amoebiformis]
MAVRVILGVLRRRLVQRGEKAFPLKWKNINRPIALVGLTGFSAVGLGAQMGLSWMGTRGGGEGDNEYYTDSDEVICEARGEGSRLPFGKSASLFPVQLIKNLDQGLSRYVDSKSPLALDIVLVNTCVFFGWRLIPEHIMYKHFTVSASGVASGRIHTLLTSNFSHQGPLHFLANNYIFLQFSDPVIRVIGEREFLGLYVGAGLLSGIGHCGLCAIQALFRRNGALLTTPGLGASGCVIATAALFVNLFPSIKLQIIFLPFTAIAGKDMINALIGFDIIGGIAGCFSAFNSPLAHGAHLGGALTGLYYYHYRYKKKRRQSRGSGWRSL